MKAFFSLWKIFGLASVLLIAASLAGQWWIDQKIQALETQHRTSLKALDKTPAQSLSHSKEPAFAAVPSGAEAQVQGALNLISGVSGITCRRVNSQKEFLDITLESPVNKLDEVWSVLLNLDRHCLPEIVLFQYNPAALQSLIPSVGNANSLSIFSGQEKLQLHLRLSWLSE